MADVTINGILLPVTLVRIEKIGNSWVVSIVGGRNLGYAELRGSAIDLRNRIITTHNSSVYAATRVTDTILCSE